MICGNMNRFTFKKSKKIGDNFALKNVILAVMVFLTYTILERRLRPGLIISGDR